MRMPRHPRHSAAFRRNQAVAQASSAANVSAPEGPWRVAMGGAQRNPWSRLARIPFRPGGAEETARPSSPMPESRIFLRPCRGGYACITLIQRVPLRSTRGTIPQPRAIARMADVAADPRVGRRTPTVSDGRHGDWPLHERTNRCKDHRPALLAIALFRDPFGVIGVCHHP